MIIVYYRKDDGTIRYFHEITSHSLEDLEKRAIKYNEESHGEKAFVAEFQTGSIEEHLVKHAFEVSSAVKDDLRFVKSALQDALSTIECLM